jgi:hypothetical protein
LRKKRQGQASKRGSQRKAQRPQSVVADFCNKIGLLQTFDQSDRMPVLPPKADIKGTLCDAC